MSTFGRSAAHVDPGELLAVLIKDSRVIRAGRRATAVPPGGSRTGTASPRRRGPLPVDPADDPSRRGRRDPFGPDESSAARRPGSGAGRAWRRAGSCSGAGPGFQLRGLPGRSPSSRSRSRSPRTRAR